MANFFLIDHSLRKSGGHHFDYVRCVAKAASELGFMTTIGANRGLAKQNRNRHQSLGDGNESLESLGNVRRVFRDTTYQADSYLAGLQHLTRSESFCHPISEEKSRVSRGWKQLKRFQHSRRRESFVRRFAVDCERYFRPLIQMPGDHALLTTVSELELMGLAVYLSNHSKTLQTNWHLQFHFNLLDGRTPEYEGQEHVIKAVRACCLAALSRLSYHSINFYTTSETLVDQYNRLGVGEFEVLPYPVSSDFSPEAYERSQGPSTLKFGELDLAKAIGRSASEKSDSSSQSFLNKPNSESLSSETTGSDVFEENMFVESSDDQGHEFGRALRITCPGEVRREKGHVEYLQPLVNEIWPTHLASGDVQIVVQRPKRKWYAKRSKIEIELPEEGADSAIEYFSHPLSHNDYVDLIRSTDCGMLFYDSRVYFSRRAGVLGELLSCGKPVIVPAGSWLAEQIQEPIYRHIDGLCNSAQPNRTLDLSDLQWNRKNVPMPGGVLSFDQANHPFEFTLEPQGGETAMVLEFGWHWPREPGVFCRSDVVQKDSWGEVLDESSQVIGVRQSNRRVKALFRLDSRATAVEFSLTNAFHDSSASIRNMSIRTFDLSDIAVDGNGVPIGSVGVIASDQSALSSCVDEMVKHFDHYRDSAVEFSKRWYSRHNPRRTVSHLMMVGESNSEMDRRVA